MTGLYKWYEGCPSSEDDPGNGEQQRGGPALPMVFENSQVMDHGRVGIRKIGLKKCAGLLLTTLTSSDRNLTIQSNTRLETCEPNHKRKG
jgi:hypothetical protein